MKKDRVGSDEKKINSINGIANINPDIDPELPKEENKEHEKIPGEKPVPEEKKFTEKDFELCKFFASVFPFFIIAEFKQNDVYNLTEKEKETLAPLWAEIFNKYLPTAIINYKEEMSLATAIFTILVLKSNVSNLVKDGDKKKTPEKEKDITDFENE